MATEDRRLINRIRSGDKGTFEELVKRHYKDVFAYCYRRTGNREDAEDLTQEVFLKLVKAIYKYRHTGKFRNFIFTIAAWAVLAAVNLILTTVYFGWEGAEAYWQEQRSDGLPDIRCKTEKKHIADARCAFCRHDGKA